MNRLVVISPHLDDAVFSCGSLIHATRIVAREPPLVVTVCAGFPLGIKRTYLDETCGFESSFQAVNARRIEDIRALRVLGAEYEHLDVLDAQYSGETEEERLETIRAGLIPVLARYESDVIVAPAGIRHADHRHVSAACEGHATLWYEEMPSRVRWPETIPERIAEGLALSLPWCREKMTAVHCYASQMPGMNVDVDLVAAERYHPAR